VTTDLRRIIAQRPQRSGRQRPGLLFRVPIGLFAVTPMGAAADAQSMDACITARGGHDPAALRLERQRQADS